MSAHPDALVSGNAVNSQQTVGRAESAPVADRPGDAAAAVVDGDSNVTEARSTAAAPDTRSRDDLASEAQAAADQLSLGRRLRQPRTIVSIVLPLFLLLLMVRVALNIDVGELAQGIRQANPLLLAAAFAIFYIGFPLRGLRWSMLLRGVNVRLSVRHSTEMIFLSWLVNCLVPAKLGDVYRGYLLKINRPEVFLSLTLGTIFMERILDLFAIAVLGIAAGYWSFRAGLPPIVQFVFALGVALVVALAIGLLTLRNFGRRALERLPLPHRVLELYDRFEAGVFGAIGKRALPGLVLITGMIWMTEALRLYFVVQALGFRDVSLGLSGAAFVAFVASLLTAVPLTPAGLGIVEAGVFGVLTIAYGVPAVEATTIALMDRTISVLSIIVLGAIAYVISPTRRGAGLGKATAPEPG